LLASKRFNKDIGAALFGNLAVFSRRELESFTGSIKSNSVFRVIKMPHDESETHSERALF
jgi:predicted HD phosphohydrolase